MPGGETRKTKVLTIDDDADIREMISVALGARGYEVVTAPGGEEGIERAKAWGPDIIVLDVEMPGLKGPEVCQRLGTDPETSHIPVIFLTGKVDLDAMSEALEGEARAYILKPFSPFTLLDRIEEVLSGEE